MMNRTHPSPFGHPNPTPADAILGQELSWTEVVTVRKLFSTPDHTMDLPWRGAQRAALWGQRPPGPPHRGVRRLLLHGCQLLRGWPRCARPRARRQRYITDSRFPEIAVHFAPFWQRPSEAPAGGVGRGWNHYSTGSICHSCDHVNLGTYIFILTSSQGIIALFSLQTPHQPQTRIQETCVGHDPFLLCCSFTFPVLGTEGGTLPGASEHPAWPRALLLGTGLPSLAEGNKSGILHNSSQEHFAAARAQGLQTKQGTEGQQ